MTPPPKTERVQESASLDSIAHELRQPLSTIESIAFYLSLVLTRDDERVQDQLARLQQLVEQSNWILTNGLQLNDTSPASPEPADLEELVTQAVAARPASADALLRLELEGDLPLVRIDPGQGRALVENLLVLFRQLATPRDPVIVRTAPAGGESVLLEFTTATPGYRSEAALGAGTALSLESARRIVEAHGGSLDLSVDPVSGIRLSVVLG
jgi:signal transduction histidine kinase